jgi:predicted nuclease of predicted toxin-antitoxin system
MPGSIRYHLDEHVDPRIASGLRRRGIDVSTTPEAGLIGANDLEHLDFAKHEGRVVFSQDADFIRHHRAGVAHRGIVYCHSGTRTLGQIVLNLSMLWEILDSDDMVNRLEFL